MRMLRWFLGRHVLLFWPLYTIGGLMILMAYGAQGQDSGPSPGSRPFKLITAASTNLTLVKGTGGNVDTIVATPVATAMFVKLYDSATTGAVTVGTTVPVATIGLPANATTFAVPANLRFTQGIVVAVTALVADADATNAAVGAPVNIFWR